MHACTMANKQKADLKFQPLLQINNCLTKGVVDEFEDEHRLSILHRCVAHLYYLSFIQLSKKEQRYRTILLFTSHSAANPTINSPKISLYQSHRDSQSVLDVALVQTELNLSPKHFV